MKTETRSRSIFHDTDTRLGLISAARQLPPDRSTALLLKAFRLFHGQVPHRRLLPPSRPPRRARTTNAYPAVKWFVRLVQDDTGVVLRPRVHAVLKRDYGDTKRAISDESTAHRSYNINTNFDTIDIGGRYDTAVRTAINEAPRVAVETYEISAAEALDLGRHLRLCDPSDLGLVAT